MRLLFDRSFGPYFLSKLMSSSGMWVHNVVAAIVVFDLTGSALYVGAVSVAQFLPQLLLAPLMGALADRGDRRRQLLIGRVIATAGSGGLALWIAVAGLDPDYGPYLVIGVAGIVGIGATVAAPAMHAILPSLVRPLELSSAVALNQMPFTLARAIGPAIGALLLATAGPAPAYAYAAFGSLVYGLVVARVRLRPVKRKKGGDRSVRAGVRHLRRDPVCIVLLAAVAALGFAIDPAITLTPSLADGFGGGEREVGMLVSAFGIGAGITVLPTSFLRRVVGLPRMGAGGMVILGCAMLGLIVAPSVWWASSAMVVAGIGMMLAISSITTQMQIRLPEELRGRVMSLWNVAFIGSRPLAAALNGALADYVAVEAALMVMAVVAFTGAVIALPRFVDKPAPKEPKGEGGSGSAEADGPAAPTPAPAAPETSAPETAAPAAPKTAASSPTASSRRNAALPGADPGPSTAPYTEAHHDAPRR